MRKVLSLIILLSIVCVSISCQGAYIDDNFLHSWMKYLDDDVKIIDVVIPGSHDAGSKGLVSNMDTQGTTIKEQLEAGVRYYDLRVKYNAQKRLAIYHGIQTGMLFETVLYEIAEFIENNPSEFLILDFQHFEIYPEDKLPELIIDVEATLAEYLNPEANALKKDIDLSKLTMGDIRQKKARYAVIWGRDEETTLAKNYIFRREDYLYSPYEKPEHQGDWDKLVNYFPNYYAVNDNSRFFVLQSQPTSGDLSLFNSTYLKDMNDYVDSIALDNELLTRTNIIMRDFIVQEPETVRAILRLNLNKGVIKKRYIEHFTLNTSKL